MSEIQRTGLALLFVLLALVSFARSDTAKALMWALAMGLVVGVVINFARML